MVVQLPGVSRVFSYLLVSTMLGPLLAAFDGVCFEERRIRAFFELNRNAIQIVCIFRKLLVWKYHPPILIESTIGSAQRICILFDSPRRLLTSSQLPRNKLALLMNVSLHAHQARKAIHLSKWTEIIQRKTCHNIMQPHCPWTLNHRETEKVDGSSIFPRSCRAPELNCPNGKRT